MKLFTVFVTHDRLELTQIALASYLATVTLPYDYIVVDNASTDGTREWLIEAEQPSLLLGKNYYPGFATNQGWERAPQDATHLQRADNDFRFLKGWCDEVLACFAEQADLGQLGLRTDEEEAYCRQNVGGNNIILRELWDRGLRYREDPWSDYEPGLTEDSFFSPRVSRLGWRWGRVSRHIIQDLAIVTPDDEYYQRTWAARGLDLERLR